MYVREVALMTTPAPGLWQKLIFALVVLATAFTILASSDCGDPERSDLDHFGNPRPKPMGMPRW